MLQNDADQDKTLTEMHSIMHKLLKVDPADLNRYLNSVTL